MAWGEVHVMSGYMIQEAACGDEISWLLVPAVTLAIASHWPLDDLNVGQIAKIYHGTGKEWRNVCTTLLRIPLVVLIAYVLWNNPVYMICGLPAWLVLDHEWVLNFFGRHGYGLHKKYMWPAWLQGEWGLVPWFIIIGLLLLVVSY